jgi:hypothetical protein
MDDLKQFLQDELKEKNKELNEKKERLSKYYTIKMELWNLPELFGAERQFLQDVTTIIFNFQYDIRKLEILIGKLQHEINHSLN